MGIFGKKKEKIKESARETSKKITDGLKSPQHLGKYTAPMINQEIFSLANTKPAFRAGKWDSRFDKVKEAVMAKLSRNENSIMCQVWLRDLEKIKNER